jgi:3-dehydroquinate synthase
VILSGQEGKPGHLCADPNSQTMQYTVPLGTASTELLVGRGSSRTLADNLRSQSIRSVVVSDNNVKLAVADRLFSDSEWLVVPAGESSKSLQQTAQLWSRMLALGLDRSASIVAVGGGVVGDLAGFAAATYLRGVSFYSVPTSLLAMVDASVGGKVGIDLPEGKNLVGQFYPARMVAVDPDLLDTLPENEWSAGMAEVIKHGILAGSELWDLLLGFRPGDRGQVDRLESLVTAAVEVKVKVVQEDPYEKTGLRATLNLGHSYGHAIEWCSGFQMNHGQAVGLGLIAGIRLSKKLGLLEDDFEPQLLELLRRWNLPTALSGNGDSRYSWENMESALGRDKKNRNGEWCFVLPQSIGKVATVYGPPKEAVREAFRGVIE